MSELRAAIIQDFATREVLMLGYMDEEAERLTRETGEVHFFSRSRQRLWKKGETSGNVLTVNSIVEDCDGDALLIDAVPVGPTCHTGTRSCFSPWLWRTIVERDESQLSSSYTVALLREGTSKIAQKVGEEATETVVAALSESDERVLNEVADLWFHVLVLLRSRGLSPEEVERVLRDRHTGS